MLSKGPDNEQYTEQRFPADSRCGRIGSNGDMDNNMGNYKTLVNRMNF